MREWLLQLCAGCPLVVQGLTNTWSNHFLLADPGISRIQDTRALHRISQQEEDTSLHYPVTDHTYYFFTNTFTISTSILLQINLFYIPICMQLGNILTMALQHSHQHLNFYEHKSDTQCDLFLCARFTFTGSFVFLRFIFKIFNIF